MKDRKIERRDFLKLTAAAAIAPSVLTATAGAQEKKKLYKSLIMGMLPGKLSNVEKFRLAKKCGFE